MDDIKLLYKTLESEFGKRGIEATHIPGIITSNLNQKLQIRPYQTRAFQYFIKYWTENFEEKPRKNQLLFHMATGSGKTLIMAGLILYLYQQGYRNFLFFVNSTNIIDKTRDNFFNDSSIKYLFNTSITQGEKKITLREVDNFQSADDKTINIAFSTIQGLHLELNNPKENGITFDDFQDKKIVLISDEAHHINVETKAGLKTNAFGEPVILNERGVSTEEALEVISWESTVNKIFNANPENILLEFTATVDFNNPNIAKKYAERLIFDYQLKQFRTDGYSKDVKVLQADLANIDRALQAILLSQYRRKIFEKNKIIIKPVVLFKSKTIAESRVFQETFIRTMKALTVKKITEIKANAKDEIISRMFRYFDQNKISLENLVDELRGDFSVEKMISVNSKEESDEKQLAINTLEDPRNEYRAVFAVDKLNEGWDVLNLFDIVRLYDTRDAKNNKPGETTIREAQLIGRGARYCPFIFAGGDNVSKRKFDEDPENEIRICEELYYHSSYNPKYIQELTSALVKTGIMPDKVVKRELKIKEEFRETKFYKYGYLFLNEQQQYSGEDVYGFSSVIKNTLFRANLRTGFTLSSRLFEDSDESQGGKAMQKVEKNIAFKDLPPVIVKKAIFKLDFYSFSNLKEYFPHLESLDDFIKNDAYLGCLKGIISSDSLHLNNLTADDLLDFVLQVLQELSKCLIKDKKEYRGSKQFKPHLIKDKILDKTLFFTPSESEDREYGKSMSNAQETDVYLNLVDKPWHIFADNFGTSEEKHLVKYIDKIYSQLKENYDEVYLVRNDRFFKLYNFEDGRPLEPDYVLFMSKKDRKKSLYYQIFIEPKGKHLEAADLWKQNFLTSLRKEHKVEQIVKDKQYVVWGLPFFNQENERDFDDKFTSSFL